MILHVLALETSRNCRCLLLFHNLNGEIIDSNFKHLNNSLSSHECHIHNINESISTGQNIVYTNIKPIFIDLQHEILFAIADKHLKLVWSKILSQ